MIFTHSGNSGDIVFSLPAIRAICQRYATEAIVYIKAVNYAEGYPNQYEFVKDLLLIQPYIKEVRPYVPLNDNWNYFNWEGIKPDIDLDEARHQRNRGRIHIIKRYFDQFGINEDHTKPFLVIDENEKRKDRYSLVHVTGRWNGYQYDWKKILSEVEGEKYFVGFESEWKEFCTRYGEIEYIKTGNLLDIARLVRDAENVICNQGVTLTLAVGLGKNYYLAPNGQKTNCILQTSNETVLHYLIKGHTIWVPDSHLRK